MCQKENIFKVNNYLMKWYTTMLAFYIAVFITCCGEESPKKNSGSNDTSVINNKAASDTVNSPRLVTQSGNKSLELTAETGKAEGPEIKYMPEWRAFGWFTGQDSVTWDIEITTPGEYDVQLEWSVSDEEAGKEFILRAGDKELTGTVDKSGSWETYKTKNIGRVDLKKGRQKIIFKSKMEFDTGGLLDLRQINLVKR